jgi:hypothetical protein
MLHMWRFGPRPREGDHVSKRKPVLPTLRWVVDNHTGIVGPANLHKRNADAELLAAEAVIRRARYMVKVNSRHRPGIAYNEAPLTRALSRLDRLTKGGER